MPKYISTAEAAKAMGVTPKRVQQLAAEGRIKGARKVGIGPRATWLLPTDKQGRVTVEPGSRGPAPTY